MRQVCVGQQEVAEAVGLMAGPSPCCCAGTALLAFMRLYTGSCDKRVHTLTAPLAVTMYSSITASTPAAHVILGSSCCD
jgi:hypothetical protein